ncbi:AMP-binding protein, partial [Rhodococcoides fascians]|uniref:AMP-binding protein n=1 Tax=Rhodococcoides fascians TaxID=1828 RepID=UPI0018AF57C5
TGDTEWTIALIAHHHAIDEWSTPALLTDLAAAYTARQAGTAPTWTPLPVTYAHYATWQRTTLGDAADPTSELSRHLDYWRTTLTDAPDESIITLDHPRPAHPTGHGTDITFTIDPHTAAAARTVAAQHGVSMFTLTHTVTAITASLLGAGTDIIIGSPIGGRTEHGLENLIGYFVNTLPLRHHLHPNDTTITDLLTTTHHTILDGLAHQHAPFETITRTTNTPRTTNRTPLFQILLTHNSTDGEPTLDLPGINVTNNGPSALGAVKTDLDLDLADTPHGIIGHLTYATELFTPATIDRFTTTFQRVLQTLATAPETRLSALDALPAADSDQISTLSAGPVVSVADSTVDVLTRRQANVSADAVAVIVDDSGTEFSYTDFDARINALAHVLIERGVQVGDRVAVHLPRSVDLVTALLAVIRVGAAYVPIDPEYPDQRITHILDDASPTVVITEEFLDNPVVAARLTRGERAAPVLARALTPADTAYVLFTSGTTGRPKGVMISHQAIINRLTWMAEDYALGPGDRILQKTPAVFDVSVWEFFLPAVVGATLVVAKDGGHKDPSYLAEVIDRHQITVLHFVPAMLAAFLGATPDPDRLASVR